MKQVRRNLLLLPQHPPPTPPLQVLLNWIRNHPPNRGDAMGMVAGVAAGVVVMAGVVDGEADTVATVGADIIDPTTVASALATTVPGVESALPMAGKPTSCSLHPCAG